MNSQHKISGRVLGAKTGIAIPGLRVEAWDKDLVFHDFLGMATTDEQGRFSIEFKSEYYQDLIFDRKPDIFFKVFRDDGSVVYSGKEVLWNVGHNVAGIVIKVKDEPVSSANGTVKGRVSSDAGLAVGNIRIVAYAKGITKDIRLGASITDSKGNYTLHYKWEVTFREHGPDILLKVFSSTVEKDEIGRADVKYNALSNENIDIIIRASAVPRLSEYERLVGDLIPLAGKTGLHGLRENATKDNITLLSNKTGWDSRMVAMAAVAEKLGRETGADPMHYYALFRAGISGDADSLGKRSPASIEKILFKAVSDKVIPEGGDIAKTLKIQAVLHTESMLKRPNPGAVSTLDSLLDIRLKATEKVTFTTCFKEAGGDMVKFWNLLPEKGFAQNTIDRLKVDGKLGYLTQHNAPLIKKLYQKHEISDPVDLVKEGYYKASAWKDFMGNEVPGGLTAEDYAAGLANMIKLSYPTEVTAQMVLTDEVKTRHKEVKNDVHQFLNKAAANYTLGIKPIKQWDGYGQLKPNVQDEVRRVERLFQVTPSDEAMAILSGTGFNSAFEIVKCQRKEFISQYIASSGNAVDAEKIYTKSHEVYSASLNLATMYLTHRANPNIYGISGKQEKQQDEIIASPTLEELFGNMDYCSCDQCKSVLSAAAYMVDLLQFIDLKGLSYEGTNPIDVLLGRRPDLQHIQLSCENTNTALPYIDLVNEILEHHVLNGNLDKLKGHDVTPSTNSADLLADPAYVEETAYSLVKSKVYPYSLPFDMPLEALKLIFKGFDSSLEEALDIFGNALSARNARLGLNKLEYQILTDITLHKLPEYFGEPAAATIDDLNCSVANAKIFCQRLESTNNELVDLLKSRFINPGSVLIPLLEKLDVESTDIIALYEGTLSGSDFKAKLYKDFPETDYGGDVLLWLNTNKSLISSLITLTDISSNPVECNFAEVQLRHFLPDKSKSSLCKDGLDTIDYHRLHRFVRLLKKLKWNIATLDMVLTAFLPVSVMELTEANIDEAFVMLLARVANFRRLMTERVLSDKKIPAWLVLWDSSKSKDFRTEALGKLLKMRIEDILDLSKITGIDPLAADMDADSPALLRFLKVIADLKHIPVKIADLNYLLRNKDETGKLTMPEEKLLQSVKSLRDAINAIDADLGTAAADSGLSYAKMKLALVYDSIVVDNFFSLLGNSKVYEAPLLMIEEYLPLKLSEKDPNLGYDPFRKLLTYNGNLSDPAKLDLKNLADALLLADMGTIVLQADLNTLKVSIKTALDLVQAAGVSDLTAFSGAYPELKAVYDTVKPISDPAGQSEALIKAILPDLALKLKTTALRQVLTSQLKCDPLITQVLTERAEVLASIAVPASAILEDFLQLAETPVFNDNKAYDFYLDPPSTDNYILYISAPSGTVIQSLSVGNIPLITTETISGSGEIQNVTPLTLQAGLPVKFHLEILALPAGKSAEIRWRTKGMAKSQVAKARLYDSSQVDLAKTSIIRLQKAAMLQKILNFTPEEYRWFAGDSAETMHFLNAFDSDGSITDPHLHILWEKISLLVFFTALKNESETEENSWLQIFKKPDTRTPSGNLLLTGLENWKEPDLNLVLNKQGFLLNDLSKLNVLKKVIPAMNLIYKINYPVTSIISWSTDTPTYSLLTDCKAMIRERTEGTAWLETMQSINDPLRNMRRDALVSYILFHKRPADIINTADKLYEYFLIDVQMDACMMTSRIRGALSTIQLFIQRCLMNLEPEVSASSINPLQWEWMKRYRVWEANRKVFLYPENWLEPELRDGKSSFFSELEGELLSADINDELAESAFLNYLKKLDDVARLEIVGTYLQEDKKGNQKDDILHVIGRTNGVTRQFFYRRYEYGYWTPWEKISANIEGSLVYPVIWKSRLFLFWLNVIVKPADAVSEKPVNLGNQNWSQSAKKNVEINMCWAEYYKGKWTSPKSTELNNPMQINNVSSFDSSKLILVSRTETINKREKLIFTLFNCNHPYNDFKIIYTSKNIPPAIFPATVDDLLFNNIRKFLHAQYLEDYYAKAVPADHDFNKFRIPSQELNVSVEQPALAEVPVILEHLFSQTSELLGGFRLLPTRHIIRNQWEAPLYFNDEHSTFYIKPDEQLTLALWAYEDYYDIGYHDFTEYPAHVPPLHEDPLFPDFEGVVIDPVDEFLVNTNKNIDKVLSSALTFSFDKAIFGPGGKVNGKTGMFNAEIQ